MIKIQDTRNKPLIIYIDDDGTTKKTYSNYEIKDNIISFNTQQNKLTLPISRIVKIKEDLGDDDG